MQACFDLMTDIFKTFISVTMHGNLVCRLLPFVRSCEFI